MNVVAVGTILGHSCCSALAVVGGRYFSTKISVKQGMLRSLFRITLVLSFHPVTLGGACLFLVFGVIYLYQSLQEILY